jgi:hypothetical protein
MQRLAFRTVSRRIASVVFAGVVLTLAHRDCSCREMNATRRAP